jgi:predicted MFS family arabinose efflux permease
MRSGALGHRQFRLLFFGQAISALGDRLVPVALAFAVLDLTGSVEDLGLVLAASTVPLVAFALIGGVWADRLPRQRVMLLSDVVRALSQGATATLLITHEATLGLLIALQALYGTAEAFFEPAAYAVRPQTVPAENLQEANALMGLTVNAADVAGPALAGVLIVASSAGWGLAFDAATFLVSAIFLSRMRLEHIVAPATGIWRELREGWQAFRSRTWLWTSVLFFTCWTAFVLSPLQVLGAQVSRLYLGGAPAWAAINTAIGAGAVAGALIAMRWRPRHPLRVSFLLGVLSTPLLAVGIGLHVGLPALLAVAVLEGVAISVFNTMWFTAQQRTIPPAELSRVTSWDLLGTIALRPVGLALAGPLGVALGLSTTLYLAAALDVALTLAILAVPSVRNLTLEPLAGGTRDATAVPLA